MKKIHSTTLFAGAFVASLLLAPSSAKAEIFGYTGIKSGYSHLFQAKALYEPTKTDNPKKDMFSSSHAPSFAFGANVGLGYLFTSEIGIRFEAEYLYRARTNFKERYVPGGKSKFNLEAQLQSLLGNAYLDYYLTPSINLYLSAGLGVGFRDYALHWVDSQATKTKKLSSRKDKAGFAWQMGLGVGYAITEELGLDFNLRYVNFGEVVFEQIQFIDALIHFPLSSMDVLLGFNYRF